MTFFPVHPRAVARAAMRWPVDSQLRARRNALVASTRLAGLTHERREVEAFLVEHERRWHARRAVAEQVAPVARAL